jgi:N utilization substance protein B
VGIRRQGRELALTYIYQLDLGVENIHDVESQIERDGMGSRKVREFAKSRVLGVWQHLKEIDDLIVPHLEHWKMERLTRTDRGLLRLGVYEMIFDSVIPHKVAINEAVDIARKFGGEDSSRFINGVLDGIYHSRRRPG